MESKLTLLSRLNSLRHFSLLNNSMHELKFVYAFSVGAQYSANTMTICAVICYATLIEVSFNFEIYWHNRGICCNGDI